MLVGAVAGVDAQWVSHPTPGLPRTADGKPNLRAPAPRAADGKPDLSGVWQAEGASIPELVKLLPGGPKVCRRIGVVTGGAGAEVKIAASEGVDTFVTGEGPHWTYALAEELGVNVLYGGHYATETFGVKALAAHLSKKFRVPWVCIDHPTGL